MTETGRPIQLADLSFTRETIQMSVPARFEQVSAQVPEQMALTGDGRSWTYAALNRQANRIAHAINGKAKTGMGCVAILADPSPEMVLAALAVAKAGKIYFGIHPGMPPAAQVEIIRDAAPDLILATSSLSERAHEIASGFCPILIVEEIDKSLPDSNPENNPRPQDPVAIFYTSGTTGKPKGVVKSHSMVMHRVWLSTQHDRITINDRQSLLTHCAFSESEADIFGILLQGGTLCVFDVAAKGLTAFREWIDEEKITLLHPPVLLFRNLLATLEGSDLFPSVRLVALTDDFVLPSDLRKWRRYFTRSCVLLHRFSTTETSLLTVARFDSDTLLDSKWVEAGLPVMDKTLTLVNENGQPVEQGEIGELLVRSRFISDGYWRHPQETAVTFTSAPDDSGERIFRTGDRVRFISDGSLVFLGRPEHLAKVRGFQVDIREVEEALWHLDEVSVAAVIVLKEEAEDRLCAFVEMKPEVLFDPKSLRLKLSQLLPDWKLPSLIESVPGLPTTPDGKIDRQLLSVNVGKNPEEGSEEPGTCQQDCGSSHIETELAEIWKSVLSLDEVGVDDNFLDLGANSISVMAFQSRLEKRFGIRIALRSLFVNPTVRQLAAVLERDLSS